MAFCTFYTLVCRFRRSRGAKSSKTFEKTDFLIFSCPFENFFCSEDLNTIQTDRNLTKSTLADSISPGVFESHRMERAHPPKIPPRLTIDIPKSLKTDITRRMHTGKLPKTIQMRENPFLKVSSIHSAATVRPRSKSW